MNGKKDEGKKTPAPFPTRFPDPDSEPEYVPDPDPDEDAPEPGRGDVLPAQVDPDEPWDRE